MSDIHLSADRMFAHVHVHDDGRREPRIDVSAPKGMPWEQLQACLAKLAREVRQATPDAERWLVMDEDLGGVRGRVYLELDQGTEQEAARGLSLLRQIVG